MQVHTNPLSTWLYNIEHDVAGILRCYHREATVDAPGIKLQGRTELAAQLFDWTNEFASWKLIAARLVTQSCNFLVFETQHHRDGEEIVVRHDWELAGSQIKRHQIRFMLESFDDPRCIANYVCAQGEFPQ